jgi:Ni2+-binding GTPase involved in maturation of urease and hydrogenase
MSLTIQQCEALYKLNPTVAVIRGDIAYDADNNEVAYDLEEVIAQAEAGAQAAIDAKQVSLAKLATLGFTADDVRNILGS